MSMTVLISVIVLLLVINVCLWKFGFVHTAEKPEPLIDRPVMDSKERRAVMKRLKRWREEGKLTAPELEHFLHLIDSEWDKKD